MYGGVLLWSFPRYQHVTCVLLLCLTTDRSFHLEHILFFILLLVLIEQRSNYCTAAVVEVDWQTGKTKAGRKQQSLAYAYHTATTVSGTIYRVIYSSTFGQGTYVLFSAVWGISRDLCGQNKEKQQVYCLYW